MGNEESSPSPEAFSETSCSQQLSVSPQTPGPVAKTSENGNPPNSADSAAGRDANDTLSGGPSRQARVRTPIYNAFEFNDSHFKMIGRAATLDVVASTTRMNPLRKEEIPIKISRHQRNNNYRGNNNADFPSSSSTTFSPAVAENPSAYRKKNVDFSFQQSSPIFHESSHRHHFPQLPIVEDASLPPRQYRLRPEFLCCGVLKKHTSGELVQYEPKHLQQGYDRLHYPARFLREEEAVRLAPPPAAAPDSSSPDAPSTPGNGIGDVERRPKSSASSASGSADPGGSGATSAIAPSGSASPPRVYDSRAADYFQKAMALRVPAGVGVVPLDAIEFSINGESTQESSFLYRHSLEDCLKIHFAAAASKANAAAGSMIATRGGDNYQSGSDPSKAFRGVGGISSGGTSFPKNHSAGVTAGWIRLRVVRRHLYVHGPDPDNKELFETYFPEFWADKIYEPQFLRVSNYLSSSRRRNSGNSRRRLSALDWTSRVPQGTTCLEANFELCGPYNKLLTKPGDASIPQFDPSIEEEDDDDDDDEDGELARRQREKKEPTMGKADHHHNNTAGNKDNVTRRPASAPSAETQKTTFASNGYSANGVVANDTSSSSKSILVSESSGDQSSPDMPVAIDDPMDAARAPEQRCDCCGGFSSPSNSTGNSSSSRRGGASPAVTLDERMGGSAGAVTGGDVTGGSSSCEVSSELGYVDGLVLASTAVFHVHLAQPPEDGGGRGRPVSSGGSRSATAGRGGAEEQVMLDWQVASLEGSKKNAIKRGATAKSSLKDFAKFVHKWLDESSSDPSSWKPAVDVRKYRDLRFLHQLHIPPPRRVLNGSGHSSAAPCNLMAQQAALFWRLKLPQAAMRALILALEGLAVRLLLHNIVHQRNISVSSSSNNSTPRSPSTSRNSNHTARQNAVPSPVSADLAVVADENPKQSAGGVDQWSSSTAPGGTPLRLKLRDIARQAQLGASILNDFFIMTDKANRRVTVIAANSHDPRQAAETLFSTLRMSVAEMLSGLLRGLLLCQSAIDQVVAASPVLSTCTGTKKANAAVMRLTGVCYSLVMQMPKVTKPEDVLALWASHDAVLATVCRCCLTRRRMEASASVRRALASVKTTLISALSHKEQGATGIDNAGDDTAGNAKGEDGNRPVEAEGQGSWGELKKAIQLAAPNGCGLAALAAFRSACATSSELRDCCDPLYLECILSTARYYMTFGLPGVVAARLVLRNALAAKPFGRDATGDYITDTARDTGGVAGKTPEAAESGDEDSGEDEGGGSGRGGLWSSMVLALPVAIRPTERPSTPPDARACPDGVDEHGDDDDDDDDDGTHHQVKRDRTTSSSSSSSSSKSSSSGGLGHKLLDALVVNLYKMCSQEVLLVKVKCEPKYIERLLSVALFHGVSSAVRKIRGSALYRDNLARPWLHVQLSRGNLNNNARKSSGPSLRGQTTLTSMMSDLSAAEEEVDLAKGAKLTENDIRRAAAYAAGACIDLNEEVTENGNSLAEISEYHVAADGTSSPEEGLPGGVDMGGAASLNIRALLKSWGAGEFGGDDEVSESPPEITPRGGRTGVAPGGSIRKFMEAIKECEARALNSRGCRKGSGDECAENLPKTPASRCLQEDIFDWIKYTFWKSRSASFEWIDGCACLCNGEFATFILKTTDTLADARIVEVAVDEIGESAAANLVSHVEVVGKIPFFLVKHLIKKRSGRITAPDIAVLVGEVEKVMAKPSGT